mmetsp:Transcript_77562/g.245046  ORF Transcript_77562/g.245046 Transcript_77562/m.245046 type:complete len:248 (-) Transcript_77562:1365-2108(-)
MHLLHWIPGPMPASLPACPSAAGAARAAATADTHAYARACGRTRQSPCQAQAAHASCTESWSEAQSLLGCLDGGSPQPDLPPSSDGPRCWGSGIAKPSGYSVCALRVGSMSTAQKASSNALTNRLIHAGGWCLASQLHSSHQASSSCCSMVTERVWGTQSILSLRRSSRPKDSLMRQSSSPTCVKPPRLPRGAASRGWKLMKVASGLRRALKTAQRRSRSACATSRTTPNTVAVALSTQTGRSRQSA